MVRKASLAVVAAVLSLSVVPRAAADPNDIFRDSSNKSQCPLVNNKSAACTSFSFSLTVGSNSNRLLIGAVAVNGANPTVTMTWTPTAGSPQTFTTIGNFQGSGGNQSNDGLTMLSLVAPTSGSGTITVSITGGGKKMCGGAMGFYNVAQTNPSTVSATGNSAAPSITVSTADRHLVVDAMSNSTGSTGVSGVGTAQTQEYSIDTNNGNGGGGETGVAASSKPGCTTGTTTCPTSTTMSWTLSAIDKWSIMATDLTPFTTPTAVTLTDFAATRCANSTMLTWHTASEVNTSGFNLYREQDGVLHKINDRLIPGSMLNGLPVYAGQSYAFRDRHSDGTWWLEERDAHGQVSLPRAATLSSDDHACEVAAASPRPQIRRGPIESATRVRSEAITGSSRRRAVVPPASEQNTQLALAGSANAFKIAVDHDGVYRIAAATLNAKGFLISDARNLQLFNRGKQIPIALKEDGTIEFVGYGVDLPSTSTNIYWLIQGTSAGLRIARTATSGGAAPAAQSFAWAVERDERITYLPTLLNGQPYKWWGPILTSDGITMTLPIVHAATKSASHLTLHLLGPGTGQHSVRVMLNDALLDQVSWNGPSEYVATLETTGRFIDGSNKLTILNLDSTDGLVAGVVHADYMHTYDADGDALQFTATGDTQTTIRGFTSAAVRVFDVTNADTPREWTGTISGSNGAYSLTITPAGSGTHTLIALTDAKFDEVKEIKANKPSHLSLESNNGKWLAITDTRFINELQPLAQARRAQGLSVTVADIEDIYDEFGFGLKTTDAITAFLVQAKKWHEPPRFLLLAGDSSFDPRNYLGLGDYDLVPTTIIDTLQIQTACDDCLTSGSDLSIGRLPARTADDIKTMVTKILQYESSTAGTWQRNVVAIADEKTSEDDFETTARANLALAPATYTTQLISSDKLGYSSARTALQQAWSSGAGLVNYIGHGSVEVWAGGNLLRSSDAASLNNGAKLPVVLGGTCLNGFFDDLYTLSIAEALMEAKGAGAAAVFASSGMTPTRDQTPLQTNFLRAWFDPAVSTIGECTSQAKSATPSADVRRTWMLFGDPAMRIMRP